MQTKPLRTLHNRTNRRSIECFGRVTNDRRGQRAKQLAHLVVHLSRALAVALSKVSGNEPCQPAAASSRGKHAKQTARHNSIPGDFEYNSISLRRRRERLMAAALSPLKNHRPRGHQDIEVHDC